MQYYFKNREKGPLKTHTHAHARRHSHAHAHAHAGSQLNSILSRTFPSATAIIPFQTKAGCRSNDANMISRDVLDDHGQSAVTFLLARINCQLAVSHVGRQKPKNLTDICLRFTFLCEYCTVSVDARSG